MATDRYHYRNVCAIVTTFRPDEGLPERVSRVLPQVGRVVIVDDGESRDNVERLQSWFGGMPEVVLVHNEKNVGIAAALNRGVAVAERDGYDWLLTLDDDTRVEPDMVANLLDAWQRIEAEGGRPPGLLGMLSADVHTGWRETAPAGMPYAEKRGIITSGTLMSLEVFRAVGPFREEFFIDGVDYDYCLRARAQGFRVIKLSQLGMHHPVGQRSLHRLLGFPVETSNHSAFRRYYGYRNATTLAREHFRRDPKYAVAVHLFLIRTALLVLLFESDKSSKLRCMARGFRDGVRRRLGRTMAPA